MQLQRGRNDRGRVAGLSSVWERVPYVYVVVAAQMLLRVLRGRVFEGREAEFVDINRRQVAEGARAPGLLAFMAGYRRVGGSDRFTLVSTWASEEVALRTVGEDERPRAASALVGAAEIERLDRYELREPVYRGILDAPGAVIRLTSATIRPGRRNDLVAWLEQKEREMRTLRLLLAWAFGEREVGDEQQVLAITAWPSPLMIEAVAEPGREGTTLFAALDEFVTGVEVEQYQAIELQLPLRLADVGSRRVLAARFASEKQAQAARSALSDRAESASEAGISVARLASNQIQAPEATDQHVLVTRVSLVDYQQAERLIADHGGQVILAADELP